MPQNLGIKLTAELERGDFQLVYASTKGVDDRVWAQPVFCLMRANLQESLDAFLRKGDFKIDRWFQEIKSSTVVFDDEQVFANVNTLEELKSLEAISA
ncbi:hypothetical protein [Polynucleobacter necessarius]|uniref:hypothetical protein n=1 Tax=Polynucleobacter necessarius TaxID=576610 RepID=UPI001E4C690E|nr:hypothetical protein [Polynucleobacter necessarius]